MKCDMCKPKEYSRLLLGVCSHEVIEITNDDLKGKTIDLSIGFWNNDRSRDSFSLCRRCRVRVLREAADIIEKGIRE